MGTLDPVEIAKVKGHGSDRRSDFESFGGSRKTPALWEESGPIAHFERSIVARLRAAQSSAPAAAGFPKDDTDGESGSPSDAVEALHFGEMSDNESGKGDDRQQVAPSGSFKSPVASLATMGPAARELAHMIHTSQQLQHYADFHSCFQDTREPRSSLSPPSARRQPSAFSVPYSPQEQQPHAFQSPIEWEAARLLGRDSPLPQFCLPPAFAATCFGGLPPVPGPSNAASSPELMGPDAHAELIRSIQMLQEAQRLSALASSQIQEVYQQAGANRSNKRRPALAGLAQEPDTLPLLPMTQPLIQTEGEAEEASPADTEQNKCSICGATSTPVWRRIDKQLVCNACGLRKRRLVKKARCSDELESYKLANDVFPESMEIQP